MEWRHSEGVVPIAGGTPKQLTTNPAADGYPRYSPDGKYIAYRAQKRPGFEADRWQLMLLAVMHPGGGLGSGVVSGAVG